MSLIWLRMKGLKGSLVERALANTALAYSYGWWRNVVTMIKRFGIPYNSDESFLKDARDFGAKEARGLINAAIIRGKGVKAVIKALKYSHWGLLEKVEVKRLSNSLVRFRVFDCSARRALEKWGLPNYSCKNFTLEALQGFVGVIEPEASVECVFCSPERPPERGNASCEWLIRLPC